MPNSFSDTYTAPSSPSKSSADWRHRAASRTPCPVCAGKSYCTWTDDDMVICMRQSDGAAFTDNDRDGQTIYKHYLGADGRSISYPDWCELHGRAKKSTFKDLGVSKKSRDPVPFPTSMPTEAAEIDTRSKIYAALLERLGLSASHRQALIHRGFSDAQIDQGAYASLPKIGDTRRWEIAQEFARTYGADTLAAVPGFIAPINRDGKQYWDLAGKVAGILIPVRDATGRIAALKHRRDDIDSGSPRYVSFSSNLPMSTRDGATSRSYLGPKAIDSAHHPIFTACWTALSEVRITEGELKADLATVFTGVATIGQPGIGKWRLGMEAIKATGAGRLLVAGDADAADTLEVANGISNWVEQARKADVEPVMESWTGAKGIDDALQANLEITTTLGSDIDKLLEQLTVSATAIKEAKQATRQKIRATAAAAPSLGSAPVAPYMGYYPLDDADLFDFCVRKNLPPRDWQRGYKLRRQESNATWYDVSVAGELQLISAKEDDDGVFNVTKIKILATRLIVPRRRLKSDGSGESYVLDCLESLPGGGLGWTSDTNEDRCKIILSHAEITGGKGMLGHGLPVDAATVNNVAAFINRLIEDNRPILPAGFTTGHVGWQSNTSDGSTSSKTFLWGSSAIVNGRLMSKHEYMISQIDGGHYLYQKATDGDAARVAALTSFGDFDAWKAGLRVLKDYPLAAFMLVSEFVGPLLELLKADGFILDYSNPPETGKTSITVPSASVWGRPDAKAEGAIVTSMITTWGASLAGGRDAAALMQGIPLHLDDSNKITGDATKIAEMVTAMLYWIGGDDTGTKSDMGRGTQVQKIIRTICISTGEFPLVNFLPGKTGGARTRVLTVRGMPLGEVSPAAEATGEALMDVARHNYGWAGPAFTLWATANAANVDFVKSRFDYHRSIIAPKVRALGVVQASRLTKYLALISTAHDAALEANVLPWSKAENVQIIPDRLLVEIAAEQRDILGAEAAILKLMERVNSQSKSFLGRHEVRLNPEFILDGANGNRDQDGRERFIVVEPANGFHGKVVDVIDGDDREPVELAVFRSRFDGWCKDDGVDPKSILEAWHRAGWIKAETDKTTGRVKFEVKVGFRGEKQRMVALTPLGILVARGLKPAVTPPNDPDEDAARDAASVDAAHMESVFDGLDDVMGEAA
jgi:hypothetical protein